MDRYNEHPQCWLGLTIGRKDCKEYKQYKEKNVFLLKDKETGEDYYFAFDPLLGASKCSAVGATEEEALSCLEKVRQEWLEK
jgi:hypothetical protein